MIGVIDYEAGNLRSVTNALQTIGAKFCTTSDASVLSECEGIILPGVGAAPAAMESLKSLKLDRLILNWRKPFFGICLGMQVLFDRSEEGDTPCLGIIRGRVRKLDRHAARVPHMGWNRVEFIQLPFTGSRKSPSYFYFAHSYYVPVHETAIGFSDSGLRFSAAIQFHNFTGVQFHPEKSGAAGLSLLNSFVKSCE